LIKTTLNILRAQGQNEKNQSDIYKLLLIFDEVGETSNIDADFDAAISDRNMAEYEQVLKWCRVFLYKKSFAPFAGKEKTFSLLYPMEKLFEYYVASHVRRSSSANYEVRLQGEGKYLYDKPKSIFRIKPDIVLTPRGFSEEKKIVMDSKWKLLTKNKKNYGISQGDMYQMYAYQKKYKAEKVIMLYPLTKEMENEQAIDFLDSEDKTYVSIRFVDLLKMPESIDRIIAEC